MDVETTWSDLPEPAKDMILEQLDAAIGITPSRAAAFLAESEMEHPENDAAWHRQDATGKFKHFLRTNHGWHAAVDVAWANLEPLARSVVDAVAGEE